MLGYVTPPTTGYYTFWIASDDNSELWLSTDANPANKVRIAYVGGCHGFPRSGTTYHLAEVGPDLPRGRAEVLHRGPAKRRRRRRPRGRGLADADGEPPSPNLGSQSRGDEYQPAVRHSTTMRVTRPRPTASSTASRSRSAGRISRSTTAPSSFPTYRRVRSTSRPPRGRSRISVMSPITRQLYSTNVATANTSVAHNFVTGQTCTSAVRPARQYNGSAHDYGHLADAVHVHRDGHDLHECHRHHDSGHAVGHRHADVPGRTA